MGKGAEAFWYQVGAQGVSITLLSPFSLLSPTLSNILNRKHQASRDKDTSTHHGRGPSLNQAEGLRFGSVSWPCHHSLLP